MARNAVSGGALAGPTRVSTLELFFDLVFVFTITQLTSVLVSHPSLRGLAQVALMLGVIWWMYGGYAWLTNAVPADRPSRRFLLLGGMASYLVLALALAHAFSGAGTAFGIAYAAVVVVHATLFTRSASRSVVRNILRVAPLNLLGAAFVLAGGIAGGTTQYALWAVAVPLLWLTPKLVSNSGFEIGAEHFVERHGLVVLIAIGESVVAVGAGAHGLPVDLELAAVVALGLALSACLWWIYFGGDDERAERALRDAAASDRPRLALAAFGYCHLAILLGIVAVAAGMHEATAHPFHELETARAITLAGGVAVYLVGDVLFRATLNLGRGSWRLACAIAVVATIPLGTAVVATAQIAAIVALLGACFALESGAPLRLRSTRVPADRRA
jgi:low temperature requirement protein LtrA